MDLVALLELQLRQRGVRSILHNKRSVVQYWQFSGIFFFLKAFLYFLQREQEMRVGELGPRGAINMGGMGTID